ncbi:histidine kinase, partial [Halobacteriales archaeon SW_12_67_38]
MNGGMSVLVVDDDPAAADLAATQLERLRDAIDVTVETGVDDALARFEADPAAFDCIVSDYNMPRMDGLELLTTVREISADVPFVLFTGKGSEEIASEAVSAGVTDYLQKGTGTERYELLANRVVNAVEAHRAEERADELARINEVISEVQRELVRESTREGIEERVCACLADSAPYTLAWIGEPDDRDRVAVRERAGTGTAYLDEISVRADDTPRGRGPVGRALRSEEVRATRNIADDEAFEPWSEVVERYGHAAVIALPLAYDDADYGVLALYSSRRYAFGEEERTALAELAGTIGQAIHAAETRAALERRERDLREERAVAEGIFDAIPDAIYAFDRDGRMLRWNDAFAATVGYDDEAIAGMNALEFVPEADHDRIVERIEAVVERGETVTMESAFVTAEGETIPHEFNGTLLADGESTYGVIGSGRDIAERKRREETVATLHESTREFVRQDDEAGVATATVEAAVEVLGFPVTAVRFHDPETDTLEPIAVSAGANRVLGERSTYDRGEGRPWRALESGEPVLADGSALAHDGNDLPLESALYVPLGDHGTLSIGSPDDGFDDVDVRLAAVLAANAAAALDRVGHESRLERYKRMLDAAGDGIYALDADGRLIRDLLSRDSPGEVGDSFEATVHTAGGDTFPCEFRIALLSRVDDEFQGTVGVIRDVTERTERERELERYETMVETAPVGMFVLDAEGTIVGGNDRAASIVGHTMTDLSGEPFHTLVEAGIVPEGAIEKHTQAVRELLSADGQASASYELTVSPPEGDRRTLRGHVSLLPRGDAFEGTIVVAEDITDRKRHERSIETLHTATRAMIDATDRDAIA